MASRSLITDAELAQIRETPHREYTPAEQDALMARFDDGDPAPRGYVVRSPGGYFVNWSARDRVATFSPLLRDARRYASLYEAGVVARLMVKSAGVRSAWPIALDDGRPQSSPPTGAEPLTATCGELQTLIATALPEAPEHDAWRTALVRGLEVAVRMLANTHEPRHAYDAEKLRLLRQLLEHHRGAQRRAQEK